MSITFIPTPLTITRAAAIRPADGSVATDVGTPPAPPRAVSRPVVAVVVERHEHVLLLKRSPHVAHDRGKWHCVTGYVEDGRPPMHQALDELHEETGLRLVDLSTLDEGPVLHLPDGQGNDWPVHTYRARTHRRRLTLNWEHTAYRWVEPSRLRRFDGRVNWLEDVLRACSIDPSPPSFTAT
jgi:8-oxo-dGTP pyrophosphatase MutT (NUDIX family)